jgi:hypothetical protein
LRIMVTCERGNKNVFECGDVTCNTYCCNCMIWREGNYIEGIKTGLEQRLHSSGVGQEGREGRKTIDGP